MTLLARLREVAAEHGRMPAFIDRAGREYSYGRWLEEADAARERLDAESPPGATVVAYLARASDAEFAPLFVAALSTKRWLVPVLRTSSAAQLERICDETDPDLMISDDGSGLVFEPRASAQAPTSGAGGCIVYTSGSTGHARGVRCAADDIHGWVRRGVPLRHYGFVTQFRLDSIGGLRGLTTALAAYPVMRVGPLDVAALARLIEQRRPSSLALMPSGVQAIGRRGLDVTPPAAAAVRAVMLSGSRSGPYELEIVRLHFPAAAITDVYTSTEAGGASIVKRYSPDAQVTPDEGSPGWPVGRPAPGTEVTIVDDGHHALPEGEEGWVWLRAVAAPPRSYVTDYEREATVLRGDGWVATGDRGVLADGELFLRGRGSERVMIHGRPVSCDLVERTLLGHADVAVASVLGAPDDKLVAFVAVRSGRAREEVEQGRELRAHVRRLLGPESTPHRIVFVDELPVTDAGKVDRAALAERLRAGAIA